jgi:sirohydrochlorin ferrochelatase
MSLRLDPRRVNALKHLAGEAGMRPGDLVRQWVEERIDASRPGAEAAPAPGKSVVERLEELTARVAALETGSAPASTPSEQAPVEADEPASPPAPKPRGRPRKSASAAPSAPRIGLHDEMIAVIGERGPLSAADLAQAISERGRYLPPRSGKPLDAAMISQRVSNPTYRSRFRRSEGRIGLAEES